jgi:thymidylate synthase (FAD)
MESPTSPTTTLRPTVPAMEAWLQKENPVLDHGFVRLVDYMGDDAAVVQAARVSYGAGTRRMREDRGLLRYLMRHRHTTPFEMCELKIHVKLPIFVARQWIRHRTASVNEASGRYSVLDQEFYLPPVEAIARQSTDNKQGRAEVLPLEQARAVRALLERDALAGWETYRQLLSDHDLARELARVGLGLHTYTQWYWKVDLHNLLHFLALRLDPHAQMEIRAYAEVIGQMVADWVPWTWEAFQDFRLNAVTLSKGEVAVLRDLLAGRAPDLESAGLSQREWKVLRETFGLDQG